MSRNTGGLRQACKTNECARSDLWEVIPWCRKVYLLSPNCSSKSDFSCVRNTSNLQLVTMSRGLEGKMFPRGQSREAAKWKQRCDSFRTRCPHPFIAVCSPCKGYPAQTMRVFSSNLSLHQKRSWISSCATETLSQCHPPPCQENPQQLTELKGVSINTCLLKPLVNQQPSHHLPRACLDSS